MATLMPMEAPPAGFNFENCKRNAMLAQQGFKPPKVMKRKNKINFNTNAKRKTNAMLARKLLSLKL